MLTLLVKRFGSCPGNCSATFLPEEVHAQRSLADISNRSIKLMNHEFFFRRVLPKKGLKLESSIFQANNCISSIVPFQSKIHISKKPILCMAILFCSDIGVGVVLFCCGWDSHAFIYNATGCMLRISQPSTRRPAWHVVRCRRRDGSVKNPHGNLWHVLAILWH